MNHEDGFRRCADEGGGWDHYFFSLIEIATWYWVALIVLVVSGATANEQIFASKEFSFGIEGMLTQITRNVLVLYFLYWKGGAMYGIF
jgi:hypothetical protein